MPPCEKSGFAGGLFGLASLDGLEIVIRVNSASSRPH